MLSGTALTAFRIDGQFLSVAEELADRGLAEYRPNPAHRRAKLLAPTADGLAAVRRIAPQHADFAHRLSEQQRGQAEFARALDALRRLTGALDALESAPDTPQPVRGARHGR
ncbi:hypothetical protein E4198_13560 [Streptomyces sp. RKND-216]|uniref:hypothetical protein n=1 Tax=Streptomyces sp. RKND-216 TaxID=2562581 RepID=UPI00109DA71E|nr:hypothetical protein [Streptomyces sp. RKND-216]THA27706.1 hypothetical protein E4198_13560 [Streptomyces sp. RKND-216]